MAKYLFWDVEGFGFFKAKEDDLKREIESLTNDELKNSDDVIHLLLKTKHTIKKIEFGNYSKVDKGEIKINVRQDPRFGAYYNYDFHQNPVLKTGRRIEIYLPYSSDSELFEVKPSSYTTVLPKAEVSDELIFKFDFFSDVDKPEDIKNKINEEIKLIKKYANWLNQDIESFNNRLSSIIGTTLKNRRTKLIKDDQFFQKLDIPSKNNKSNLGFVKPTKKLNLKLLKEKKDTKIEPSLEFETYEEIVNYINDLGINLERSSQILRDLNEEPLRDIILSALNCVYKGLVSGEAFNKEGKTDLIIKYLSKILFIAECKIWRGDKSFTDGITQLLNYLTWRDTKTSYIIFSKNQRISEVINKSKELMKAHKNFISEDKKISESSARYKFRQKSDNTKECLITLHVFDLNIVGGENGKR